ncbi:universal stress protein [Geodermatophilus sp. SYSU D01176]
MDIGADAATPPAGTGTVVVGVDGSPGSRDALRYALTAASRRGADLELVASYAAELYWMTGAPVAFRDLAGIREDTEKRALDLLHDVAGQQDIAVDGGPGSVRTRIVAAPDPAAVELTERSDDAGLLVVGSRGRGAVRSALLGSVALHCVTHARCPVVVVHPTPQGTGGGARVVVGLDGSDAARAALAAAVDEGARATAEVDVVASYVLADHWTDLYSVLTPTAEQVRAEVRAAAEVVVREVLAERPAGASVPDVRLEVVEGAAQDVLVHMATGADLLVVGSHGHGPVRGILLGSVALHCAMHAPCPVMVVRSAGSRTSSLEAATA